MTVVRAAAVQISPVLYSRDGTVEKIVSKIAELGDRGDGEQIHSAMWPGSFGGTLFAKQTEISIRNHALESGSFVVNATGWLDADQQAQIVADTGGPIGPISAGSFTAIVSPSGELLGEPAISGEGEVIADLDFSLIDQRKSKMDASGHYGRPELLSLMIDRTPASYTPTIAMEEAEHVHI
jgi:nitrilase